MRKKFNEERFWSKVDKTPSGCWIWQGTTNGGAMRYNGIAYTAPRLSWIIHHGGEVPTEMVLHRCRNKKCVNPDHLFLGTVSDSIHNNKERGLNAKGEKIHKTVLNKEVVHKIKAALRRGEKISDVASRMDLTYSIVYAIHTRRTWKHVL